MTVSPRTLCTLLVILCSSGIAVTGSNDDLTTSTIGLGSDNTFSEADSKVNYIATAVLADGESETRMRFGDIIVREASVSKKNEAGVRALGKITDNDNKWKPVMNSFVRYFREKEALRRKGLLLRQLSSGPHVLQLIFKLQEGRASRKQVMKLLECEILNDWGNADQFRTQFRQDLSRAGANLPVPPNHFDFLKSENFSNSQFMEEDLSLESLEMSNGDVFNLEQNVEPFQNVSVRILRNDEVIGDLQHSFDMIAQQRQCRRLHRRMKKNAKNAKKSIGEDVSESEQDYPASKKSSMRVRREAFRVGIMPGTLWCGDGSLVDRYEYLGAHVGTDRCCREHDGCPFIIHGMASDFGVFNYRMHTVSHCTCDERFRSCLKQTNTGSSNFVGRLFFNVVQTKCFVLKAERVCTKRSWWGKCLKFEFKKQAHLKDPIPY